jgi:low affinity Fe/Cu permease
MIFALIILTRILFIACMVFIIGYVFGSFSKNRTLTVLTKVAAILTIVLFLATNAAFLRGGGRWHGPNGHRYADRHCMYEKPAHQHNLPADSAR